MLLCKRSHPSNRMKTRGIPANALAFACLLFSLSTPALARAGDNPPARRPATTPVNDEVGKRLEHLTLDDAIDIAIHRNPAILAQLQEIQRYQGLFIQMRGVALPQVIGTGSFEQQDKGLLENGRTTTAGGNSGTATDVTLRTLNPR